MMIGAVAIVGLMLILYAAVIAPARSRETALGGQLQGVQTVIGADRSQLAQLEALVAGQPAQLRKAFGLAKAVPVGTQTPGIILELQKLATASNVALSQFRTVSTTPVNNLTATDYEVNVVGRFFNVDDFMYRVHRQVVVSTRGDLTINGRLFAETSVQMTLASGSNSGSPTTDPNSVAVTLQLLAFSNAPTTTAASSSSPSGAPSTTGSAAPSSTTKTPASAGGLG